MSTTLETPNATTTPADATALYRAMVREAAGLENPPEPDLSIVRDAGKTVSDFKKDVSTLTLRRAAAGSLREEVPSWEAEAARIESEGTPQVLGQRAVSSCKTIAELNAALSDFRNTHDPSCVAAAKQRAHELRRDAIAAKTGATQMLTFTADPAIDRQVASLQREISDQRRRIEELAPMVNLETTIDELDGQINRLVEGRRPSAFANDPRENRVLLAALKLQYKALVAKRQDVPQAKKDTAAAERKIAALQREAAETAATKLHPENMAWSD